MVRTQWTAIVLLLGLLSGCAQDPESPASESTPAPASQSTPAPASESIQTPASPTSDSPSAVPSKSKSKSTSKSKPARPNTRGTKIIVGDSDYGTVLFDATGQAIYTFDVETTTKPRCYQACAEAWPPVLTTAAPLAGKGVRDPLLGTTERTDGTTQVTYRGQPLYFYAHEGKRQVKCHDVFLDGGNWYAVQPNGRRAP